LQPYVRLAGVSKLPLKISMSLDGFVAGPEVAAPKVTHLKFARPTRA
jgi:hypothetical protein